MKSFSVHFEAFDQVLNTTEHTLGFFAPVRMAKLGRFFGTDAIRYKRIRRLAEVEWRDKSTDSPKELLLPINQTLFNFVKEDIIPAEDAMLPAYVFLRSCDIHGIHKLDRIFLQNGPFKDPYYEARRKKIKFILLECPKPFDSCFCVAMGSSKTDDFAAAVRFEEDRILITTNDAVIEELLSPHAQPARFSVESPTTNGVEVGLPATDRMPQELYTHPLWEEYTSRCIACGRCNTSCISCSCFSTCDVADEDNPHNGRRRRIWDGCHLDGFTSMAGNLSFREKAGERMRFKVFHKIYDFVKRFGTPMCVGCGRCDDNCPEYISYSSVLNKVSEELKRK